MVIQICQRTLQEDSLEEFEMTRRLGCQNESLGGVDRQQSTQWILHVALEERREQGLVLRSLGVKCVKRAVRVAQVIDQLLPVCCKEGGVQCMRPVDSLGQTSCEWNCGRIRCADDLDSPWTL